MPYAYSTSSVHGSLDLPLPAHFFQKTIPIMRMSSEQIPGNWKFYCGLPLLWVRAEGENYFPLQMGVGIS